MSRWKEKKLGFSILTNSTFAEEDDQEELECRDGGSFESPNTYLLFPKESPTSSTSPLFPLPQSRKNFLIMTSKRTVFACRGFFLFCLVVILVFSFATSYSSELAQGKSSDSAKDGSQNNADIANSSKSPYIINDNNRTYRNISLPLLAGAGTQISIRINSECSYRKTDYAMITNSLKKGLEFYQEHIENITVLDAALGAKIVAEQLKLIGSTHTKLPMEMKKYVSEVSQLAMTLSDKITDTVKRVSNNSQDLKYTLPWIETKGLWELPQNGKWFKLGKLKSFEPANDGSFEDLWNIVSKKERIGENESDACIYQVFHCDTANITRNCQAVFLDDVRSMYSLTHQVIYMLLAQKNKCSAQPIWKEVPSLKDGGESFLENLCGKVWQEANSIADANFPPRFRDLFIEQIGMCALSGYTEFLQRSWLRRIISWQSTSTSGCFGGRKRRRVPTIGMLVKHYQNAQYKRHLVDKKLLSRPKRSDVYLEDGTTGTCSVHFTSVGITALSLHLRYFFDTCLDGY